MVDGVSELRQKMLTTLQQHTEAVAGCQAELAKVTGVSMERHASSSGQQSQDCNIEEAQPMDEEEAECLADKEKVALTLHRCQDRRRGSGIYKKKRRVSSVSSCLNGRVSPCSCKLHAFKARVF